MNDESVRLTFEEFGDEPFLKISNNNELRPFFMSIVSDSDHWMFISSNGGLTAGRRNAEYALFPYYTDDKITEFADITGSKSIFQIGSGTEMVIWEPFSHRNLSSLRRSNNIYKSIYSNKIIFEEVLLDYQLTFRYSWTSSDLYGFVKTSYLINDSHEDLEIVILDGLQNIMPYGVGSDLQRASSHLVDAYKRSELHLSSGLGIFALSAIIVDKAEPSEALKANIVWSLGLSEVSHLLSSIQLDTFRRGKDVTQETDIKGEKAAYFIHKKIILKSVSSLSWQFVADVNKNHSQIIKIIDDIRTTTNLKSRIEFDIKQGTQNLIQLVASSDGLQFTNDPLQDCRNYGNTLFNIMRGGIFDDGYYVNKDDLIKYIQKGNFRVFRDQKEQLNALSSITDYETIIGQAKQTQDEDFIRLCIEYLPLKFSRRHGDPSRPWNRFSINLRDEYSGNKILDYEGNWRDIFQNWEALAYSYPEYIDGMIFKFLNASTFDGYNPYRITKDGFDWETIEPDDPWSYIGYWGDHQIIYLQKFLEIIEKFKPGTLETYFDKDWFVYAGVPYIIKSYDEIVSNPKDTIIFDHHWDAKLRKTRADTGADGVLLHNNDKQIYHVNLIEKLLATLLAKLSNFIPEGGIWLNTQRPEWNDANNVLVGNGVSMVTLYYMRRFLVFLKEIFDDSTLENVKISNELIEFYHSIRETLSEYHHLLGGSITDAQRKIILDRLGKAASDFRIQIYKSGFWGKKRTASLDGLRRFIQLSLDFVEHTIDSNHREDGLYHAYNLMTYSDEGIKISGLDEMLEGQVAVLSSGYLNGRQSLEVLDAMKNSALFRPDQYSYILYPNKKLPGFLEKNLVSKEDAESNALIQKMVLNKDKSIVEKDINGNYHFNGNFKNAGDLSRALQNIDTEMYHDVTTSESSHILNMFEKIFNHKAFTGRSGTFYGYEGLGSIYWHMVSKLLLAVQESCLSSVNNQDADEIIGRLIEHYYEIQAGIGVHKSPKLFGAFPTDPYSHTPMHKGAQQPGMTGQVKEDILSKLGEFGIVIDKGHLKFSPFLLRKADFLSHPKKLSYRDIKDEVHNIKLENGQLFFTFCQVPIIYTIGKNQNIEIKYADGKTSYIEGQTLNHSDSISIFKRKGKIDFIYVTVDENNLK